MNRVAVLAGGLSLERDISLRSGQRVSKALADRGYEVTSLDLNHDLVTQLLVGAVDMAVLCLHGKAGEDGTIQGLLELADLPYTGPGPAASFLAWDKGVAKALWQRADIPTPPWAVLSSQAVRDMGAARILDRLVERLGLPLIVKPAQGGASMGVKRVERSDDLPAALITALSYHDVALVERCIDGREIAATAIDDELLPTVQIEPLEGLYDYSARYTHGASRFETPAPLDDEASATVGRVVRAATRTLGTRHLVRADLVIDEQDQPWLLELDTCPGMTETSLVPMAAEAAGMSFADLCERLVSTAACDPR
jgi:D-alanine-D-alanine ligase